MNLIEDILSCARHDLSYATDETPTAIVFNRILAEVESVHGSGNSGSVMVMDMTMVFHAKACDDGTENPYGIIVQDWIEVKSSDGSLRIVRCLSATSRGDTKISYCTTNDNCHYLMTILVRVM